MLTVLGLLLKEATCRHWKSCCSLPNSSCPMCWSLWTTAVELVFRDHPELPRLVCSLLCSHHKFASWAAGFNALSSLFCFVFCLPSVFGFFVFFVHGCLSHAGYTCSRGGDCNSFIFHLFVYSCLTTPLTLSRTSNQREKIWNFHHSFWPFCCLRFL